MKSSDFEKFNDRDWNIVLIINLIVVIATVIYIVKTW